MLDQQTANGASQASIPTAARARNRLVVLPALRAQEGSDGSFTLTRKFYDGVRQYDELWPGPVTVLLRRTDQPDGHLDPLEIAPDAARIELRWIDGDGTDVLCAMDDAALVLASLIDEHVHLPEVCRRLQLPLVYISEYSSVTRRQIIHAETANPLLRWRRQLWNAQQERRYQRAVQAADGIQCNGTPTYRAYQPINRSPMLYFDTRIRAHQLVSERTLAARTAELLDGGPLRLAFSGRLAPMKGADHLVRVADELVRLGVPFTLDICGDGPLAAPIRQSIVRSKLQFRVLMRGILEFATQLVPYISRHTDLFICCHRQGDPSCTYLETMSCGVPIVGYDNEAFRGVVQQSGVGWLAGLDRPAQVAERIAELNENRTALVEAALAARVFASRHTFESAMQARVEHLRRCAGAPLQEVGS